MAASAGYPHTPLDSPPGTADTVVAAEEVAPADTEEVVAGIAAVVDIVEEALAADSGSCPWVGTCPLGVEGYH